MVEKDPCDFHYYFEDARVLLDNGVVADTATVPRLEKIHSCLLILMSVNLPFKYVVATRPVANSQNVVEDTFSEVRRSLWSLYCVSPRHISFVLDTRTTEHKGFRKTKIILRWLK
jgi:hypothetical protein